MSLQEKGYPSPFKRINVTWKTPHWVVTLIRYTVETCCFHGLTMNWYLIAYDIFTSDPGGPLQYPAEQKQIMNFLDSLARSFADSVTDVDLDEADLFALGIKRIRDKIETFEPRSDDDSNVTRSFKAWMSKTCRNLWVDEYRKIQRRINYETEHYQSGDHNEHEDTLETIDPVDADPLVLSAEHRDLMRRIVRDVLGHYPDHKSHAILQYRSTRKGREGTRGFEGETADIAANANVDQQLIRKWSSRFEKTCLDRYEQEQPNVKSDQTASRQ